MSEPLFFNRTRDELIGEIHFLEKENKELRNVCAQRKKSLEHFKTTAKYWLEQHGLENEKRGEAEAALGQSEELSNKLKSEIEHWKKRFAYSSALQECGTALRMIYEDTADYIKINKLGDVHHNKSMQLARHVLDNLDHVKKHEQNNHIT